MERIELGVYGIVIVPAVVQRGVGAAIISDLHESDDGSLEVDQYNAGIDGIESMILAHYCAGIDVTTPAYKEGIETAVMALGNEYS